MWKKKPLPPESEPWSQLSDHNGLQRLLRLENAVMYYGGGWDVLARQVADRAEAVRVTDPQTADLLDTVTGYLNDVASTGGLVLSHWRPWRDESPEPETEMGEGTFPCDNLRGGDHV